MNKYFQTIKIFKIILLLIVLGFFPQLSVNQASAYGGSGGASGGDVGICAGVNTPQFDDLSPQRSSIHSSLSEVGFTVKGVSLDENRIFLTVNGVDYPVQTFEKGNGDIMVTGSITPPINAQGNVSIDIKATTKQNCTKNIVYFIGINQQVTIPDDIDEDEEGGSDTGSGQESVFKDITNHWAVNYIALLQEKDVVEGDGKTGMFRPNDSANRAELLAMVMRAFNVSIPTGVLNNPFPDVRLDHWFVNYVSKGRQLEFVEGYGDGLFRPSRSITRAEALKIFVFVAGIDISKSKPVERFLDVRQDAWYAQYINWATENNIINGYSDDTFRPNRPITRAEITKLLVAIMKNVGWL